MSGASSWGGCEVDEDELEDDELLLSLSSGGWCEGVFKCFLLPEALLTLGLVEVRVEELEVEPWSPACDIPTGRVDKDEAAGPLDDIYVV